MTSYDNEENAVVNNEGGISETPSDLVAKSPDDSYDKASQHDSQLSPNPAGFGFTKQLIVDSLPNSGQEVDCLYLLTIKNNGQVVGYKKYKWTKLDGFVFCGVTPDLKLENGPRERPVQENNPPKAAPEKVFTGEVVFIKEPIIKGKPLGEYIDSEGGVTEAELQQAINSLDNDLTTEINKKQDKLNGTSAPAGVVVKLLGFNADGDVVNDDVPEGIIVDDSLDTESDNAIANKPVAEKFAEIDADLEQKANVDGNYPTMTVGVADNLSPYDEESGIKQHAPFNFQASGTNNGTDPTATVGALAIMSEKCGNTKAVNQLLQLAPTSTGTINITNNNDGSITLNGTNNTGDSVDVSLSSVNIGYINAHKYLFVCIGLAGSGLTLLSRIGNYYTTTSEYSIGTANSDDNFALRVRVPNGTTLTNLKLIPFVSDLTQWFNGDISQDLLDNPENFFRYYQGSLAYNTGTLVNANSRYLKAIGRNQWDEETEVIGGELWSKNYIKVIPNADYFFKCPATNKNPHIYFYDIDKNEIGDVWNYGTEPFKTPSNCLYIKFYMASGYGTTYNNDITISLYYEGESGYDKYYPYELLTNNDTGTEVLRSAGSVYDSKAPDGTITRRIGTYTFTGSETWIAYGDGYVCADLIASAPAKNILGNVLPNCNSDVLQAKERNDIYAGSDGISVDVGNVYVSDTTNLTGKTLYYELAEPTTEQGTPYSENIIIDDFGTMDFSGTSGVPQGNALFYPVDYKAYLDTLHNYTDGDPDNLALKSDLSADKTELQSVDTQLLNAIGGTLRQCLCVKESLEFDNTAFVDLGTLSWGYSNGIFIVGIPADGKPNYNDNTPSNVICTKYKTVARDDTESTNNSISWKTEIRVNDSSYTDATAFKNAMKGVLLAYEKA